MCLTKVGLGYRKGSQRQRIEGAKYHGWSMEAGQTRIKHDILQKTKQTENPTANKRAWLSFNSQSKGEETAGFFLMRKPDM